jgi:hypothetical protein
MSKYGFNEIIRICLISLGLIPRYLQRENNNYFLLMRVCQKSILESFTPFTAIVARVKLINTDF